MQKAILLAGVYPIAWIYKGQGSCAIYHNLSVLMEEQDTNQFETLVKHNNNCVVQLKIIFQLLQVILCQQKATRGSVIKSTHKHQHVSRGISSGTKHYMKVRVNKIVHILMKSERDKGFQRLVKTQGG